MIYKDEQEVESTGKGQPDNQLDEERNPPAFLFIFLVEGHKRRGRLEEVTRAAQEHQKTKSWLGDIK